MQANQLRAAGGASRKSRVSNGKKLAQNNGERREYFPCHLTAEEALVDESGEIKTFSHNKTR
jgi:hypothetical protein